MEPDYVEAILEWSAGGPAPETRAWFVQRGFRTMPMRVGLLISADRATFERVFGVELRDADPPVELTVPLGLTAAVASIVIPKPRQFH